LTFKQVKATFKRKDPANKECYKDKNVVNNFYGKEELGVQVKRFHFIHYILKYKIIIPSMWLLKKITGKYLVKKVPDKPQFKYIKLFEEVFDDASIDWANIYLNSLKKPSKRFSKKKWKENYVKAEWSSLYYTRTVKEFANTLFCNDDAYAEWIPFFMWKTYFKMRELVENGEKDHLMRNVLNEMNPLHEMLYLQLIKQKGFKLKEAGRQK